MSKWIDTPEAALRAPEPFIPDERLGRTRDEIEREIARREIARIREEYFGVKRFGGASVKHDLAVHGETE